MSEFIREGQEAPRFGSRQPVVHRILKRSGEVVAVDFDEMLVAVDYGDGEAPTWARIENLRILPFEDAKCVRCGGTDNLRDRGMMPGATYCASCRQHDCGHSHCSTRHDPLHDYFLGPENCPICRMIQAGPSC